jgi:hypothetical protein
MQRYVRKCKKTFMKILELQYNITNCKGNVKKVRNTRKCQKMLENA